ncbi:MAG: hypothetical protein QOD91_204 [Frankiales bacterium]|nr:hypothetical protein [Frankiales bacterium]
MRVLLWHVHGSWTTAFVQGHHEYVVPVSQRRGPEGRGRAATWNWPASVVEVPLERLAEETYDVVVLQRPEDVDLVRRWLRLEPGRTVAAVYVEHNTPRGDIPSTRHPMAERSDIVVAHVTHFNALFWVTGRAPTTVIEHGIVDPGRLWSGELPRLAVAVNEPVRRGRVTGSDLVAGFSEQAPVDVFGMRLAGLHEQFGCRHGQVVLHEDLPQDRLHREMARRRVYVHPMRWTSLGLSLIEAMHLGMPVVALGTTEAYEAVPQAAGRVSTSVAELHRAVRELVHDRDAAAAAGVAARAAALDRFGLARFLDDWDRLLKEVAR